MLGSKHKEFGVSHGLAEAGYDIRLKQTIIFDPSDNHLHIINKHDSLNSVEKKAGNFTLASSIEKFTMPDNLIGVVHDKSTWARQGLSVFNTVIEPNWNGYLTLELVYHGDKQLVLPAGAGIAQVIFHEVSTPMSYNGKYNDQPDRPVDSIFS